MKLFAIFTTLLVSGLASVHAQHHLPAAATSNYNGINSPTNGNIDMDGVATITDEASDTARKLHDVLTSVKDIMEDEFGLDLIDALGGNGRRLSKSHKSDKGIDIIDKVLLLIVLLLVEFLGLGGGYDTSMLDGLLGTGEEEGTADEITAAHHGHDGSSSKTAKSEGTDASAKTTKESKSSKSGGGFTCPLEAITPGTVPDGQACCASTDCVSSACSLTVATGASYCNAGPGSEVICSADNTCPNGIIDCNPGELCSRIETDECSEATRQTGICESSE